jgi:hypothetical protein
MNANLFGEYFFTLDFIEPTSFVDNYLLLSVHWYLDPTAGFVYRKKNKNWDFTFGHGML